PTAVTATIEPVVGALLAFALLGQRLTLPGWLGLIVVVAGVASMYALAGQTPDSLSPQSHRPTGSG
ncbi:MAG TPA: hypothetical protein VNL18_05470, partial [Gemmatimonadales bacterium]|nr:hypothetical protein [Gemmatimonadales bacterium]